MLGYEKLYRLDEKDVGGFSLIVPYFNAVRTEQAETPISAQVVLDTVGDRFLVLTTASLVAVGGGAQTVAEAYLALQTPAADANQTAFVFEGQRSLAVAGTRISWSGEMLVPPRWVIQAVASFSAAVAVNILVLYLTGLLIPRGSIQRR